MHRKERIKQTSTLDGKHRLFCRQFITRFFWQVNILTQVWWGSDKRKKRTSFWNSCNIFLKNDCKAMEIEHKFKKKLGETLKTLQRWSLYMWLYVDYAAAAAKSLQSCPTLWDPIDGNPPGSVVPGILQARTLEWAAISFSNGWKWKLKVKSLSHVWLLATPWTAAYQAPPSMGFSRQYVTFKRVKPNTRMRVTPQYCPIENLFPML